jgi:hypothetical protein
MALDSPSSSRCFRDPGGTCPWRDCSRLDYSDTPASLLVVAPLAHALRLASPLPSSCWEKDAGGKSSRENKGCAYSVVLVKSRRNSFIQPSRVFAVPTVSSWAKIHPNSSYIIKNQDLTCTFGESRFSPERILPLLLLFTEYLSPRPGRF